MAARKQLFHPDEVKQKIKTSQLINRLQEHALSKEETLTRSQVRAIEVLLAKTVPDLKAIEHSGVMTLTHEQQLDQLDD
jgi:flagellar biosynthesis/type III secretory pathway M-ring protein FliF/YscJ